MKGSRSLGLGLVWASAVIARSLAAATPIEWEAPEGCPGVQIVNEELQRALGNELGELDGLSGVRGVIVAEAKGYRLTLEVSEAERRSLRSIHAERCEDLANAAALAIALAVHAGSEASDAALGARASAAPADEGAAAPRVEGMYRLLRRFPLPKPALRRLRSA